LPAELKAEEVPVYLLHPLRDKKLAYSSVNQASCTFHYPQ